jgi:hypothetical protein
MSKRIKTPLSLGRDYRKMLKDYFGKYLYGLQVEENGGYVTVQLIYFDFKHISTVRRELAQMMPEVEFTKIKRDFTKDAELWALQNLYEAEMEHSENMPVIYVQHGETIVKTSIVNLAVAELSQLDLDDDEIDYEENGMLDACQTFDDERLRYNSWD